MRSVRLSLLSIALLRSSTAVMGQTPDLARSGVSALGAPWRCYAILPDTTPSFFLPDHLILVANKPGPGSAGWRSAVIRPDSFHLRDHVYRLTAQWRFLNADSIHVQWSAPRQLFGIIGELYAAARDDSLDGRAIYGTDVRPPPTDWIRVHGNVEPCPTGF